jgi:20S proteasome subunit alpha 6
LHGIDSIIGSLDDLIRHGLHALRETLQQDKELNINNTSIGIVGTPSQNEQVVGGSTAFRILDGEKVEPFLNLMVPKDSATEAPAAPPPATAASDEDVQMA